ncbi:MAG: hypothetical protein V2I33_17315 [Kangiellaceae bacterium]|jgi:hypothetical protein|nr:hypothetical protein [Kangiellaceae bacterium]
MNKLRKPREEHLKLIIINNYHSIHTNAFLLCSGLGLWDGYFYIIGDANNDDCGVIGDANNDDCGVIGDANNDDCGLIGDANNDDCGLIGDANNDDCGTTEEEKSDPDWKEHPDEENLESDLGKDREFQSIDCCLMHIFFFSEVLYYVYTCI